MTDPTPPSRGSSSLDEWRAWMTTNVHLTLPRWSLCAGGLAALVLLIAALD
ncbi:hypothetical protein [Rhodophyticola porphyridii]|uniref:hypothetical protein n=1 Tax=Rhodophyticola porphyridii TaxID=1852017 RepID=UPI001314EE03|nr:hypothetical protein [Rhodophyticola porphyridii]